MSTLLRAWCLLFIVGPHFWHVFHMLLWPTAPPRVQKSHLQTLHKEPSDFFEKNLWECRSTKHLSTTKPPAALCAAKTEFYQHNTVLPPKLQQDRRKEISVRHVHVYWAEHVYNEFGLESSSMKWGKQNTSSSSMFWQNLSGQGRAQCGANRHICLSKHYTDAPGTLLFFEGGVIAGAPAVQAERGNEIHFVCGWISWVYWWLRWKDQPIFCFLFFNYGPCHTSFLHLS